MRKEKNKTDARTIYISLFSFLYQKEQLVENQWQSF